MPPIVTDTKTERTPFAWLDGIFCLIILALFVAAYHSTLAWMYDRYMGADSYYSHGFLIPLISGYLIWKKKDELSHTRAEFSRLGLSLIVFSALLHLLGIILYVFSISGFSIFFFVVGLSLFFLGTKNTKTIIFPLAFLLFMFPVPEAFLSAIGFPMKMLVAKYGAFFANLLGIPVYREGFYLTIPAGTLLIGNPCSGLRSLISFLALGALISHFSGLSLGRKWTLFFTAIPIALVSNILRVLMLVMIAHFGSMAAAEPDSYLHTGTGLLVFALGFLLLIAVQKLLAWKSGSKSA